MNHRAIVPLDVEWVGLECLLEPETQQEVCEVLQEMFAY